MPTQEQWEQLLTPSVMQNRLITASLYVTAFEILKESIVERIRDFYVTGIDAEGVIVDAEYAKTVLSRNKNRLYASLDWLLEHEVISSVDIEVFEQLKSTRNLLAHELPALVLQGANFKHIERFEELSSLLRKIEIWWVVNVEIPTNPDFYGKQIDENEIMPGRILMLQMMLAVGE